MRVHFCTDRPCRVRSLQIELKQGAKRGKRREKEEEEKRSHTSYKYIRINGMA